MAGNKNSGRRKTSVAEKKLNGTFRKDRHGEQEQTENMLSEIVAFDKETKIETPSAITNKQIASFYQSHTQHLINLGLLTPFDLPELNAMYEVLQQYTEIKAELKKTDITKDFELYKELTYLSEKLLKTFTSLSPRYYISPTARAKLTLDALEIEKKKSENEQSAIGKILARKN